VRSDGTVGTLTVDPADPGTAITAYRDWASACADPTRGAVFAGTGRLDRGDLTGFAVAACDNGAAESGTDFLQMDVPPYGYSNAGSLTSGNIAKATTDSVIFQDGFESGDFRPSWELFPDNARYSMSTDPGRVHSGTYSLQALYAPMNTYGTITKWFGGQDEVYVKLHVMFDAAFENPRMHFLVLAGDSVDNGGSSFGKAGKRPNGFDFFYAGLDPEYPGLGPLRLYTYYPDMSCPDGYPQDPCYGNWFTQTLPNTALLGGQWQEIVFHVKLNSPGRADGSQELWINGVEKISVQNLRWRDTTALKLNRIRFDNWMPDVSQTEHVWVDDLIVWRP
jgi:hypothetical protein